MFSGRGIICTISRDTRERVFPRGSRRNIQPHLRRCQIYGVGCLALRWIRVQDSGRLLSLACTEATTTCTASSSSYPSTTLARKLRSSLLRVSLPTASPSHGTCTNPSRRSRRPRQVHQTSTLQSCRRGIRAYRQMWSWTHCCDRHRTIPRPEEMG